MARNMNGPRTTIEPGLGFKALDGTNPSLPQPPPFVRKVYDQLKNYSKSGQMQLNIYRFGRVFGWLVFELWRSSGLAKGGKSPEKFIHRLLFTVEEAAKFLLRVFQYLLLARGLQGRNVELSLIHISEPTRPRLI
eukprot:4399586-Amphidinium_carterae.1